MVILSGRCMEGPSCRVGTRYHPMCCRKLIVVQPEACTGHEVRQQECPRSSAHKPRGQRRLPPLWPLAKWLHHTKSSMLLIRRDKPCRCWISASSLARFACSSSYIVGIPAPLLPARISYLFPWSPNVTSAQDAESQRRLRQRARIWRERPGGQGSCSGLTELADRRVCRRGGTSPAFDSVAEEPSYADDCNRYATKP